MKFKNKKTGEVIEFGATLINAALVSAQNRKRLFWVGKLVGDKYEQVKMELPEDRGILLKDILQDEVEEKYFLNGKRIDYVLNRPKNFAVKINPDKTNTLRTNYGNASANETYVSTPIKIGQLNKGGQGDRIYSPDGKSVNLSANGGGRGAKTGLYAVALRNRGEGKKPEVGGDKANSMTTVQTDSMVIENTQIRKLTPIECERLQSLTEIEQSSIIRICLDHQNNSANAEIKNHKLLNVVGSVEKSDLKETALFVAESLNINNQQINKPVQPDVLISCGENTLQIHYQGTLLVNVSGADWKQSVHHLKSIDDFVQIVVGINTIVEKITHSGKAELHQKNSISVAKENGNNVVNLFGNEIMQLANDAEKNLTTLNKLLKSITSDHFGQENNEQIIKTLFSYVVLAIFGYIPKEIQNKNSLTFQIKTNTGYTFGISNTQRYKALGNGFNCAVIEHILKNIL